jgi:hypothetical protein
MLKDLAAVTPSLLVCGAFLIAVGAFLRHEMGPRRARRARDMPDVNSPDNKDDRIADASGCEARGRRDDGDAPGAV